MKIASDYSSAEREFARVLSLHRPGQPVAFRDVQRLAREVLAMDAAEARVDAGRIHQDAFAALSEFLGKVIPDKGDLNRALELAGTLSNASLEDAKRAGGADGRRARDAEAEQRGASRYQTEGGAMDRGRLTADAATKSTLDSVLSGVRKPLRL